MQDLARGGSNRRIVLVALLGLLIAMAPVAAVQAPPAAGGKAGPANALDARVNARESYERATAARPGSEAAAVAAARVQADGIAKAIVDLKAAMPGLEVKISSYTWAPESVKNRRGALTGAAPGLGSEQIVREFLNTQGRLYGLSAADLADLAVLGDSPGGESGLRMLRMEQRIDGRPVFQSETKFLLDRDGRLVRSVGRMVPNARAMAPSLAKATLLTAPQAIVRLLGAEGRPAEASSFAIVREDNGWLRLSETDELVAGEISARQVLFPLAPGLLVPVWSLVVFTNDEQDWYAIVDAETGAVLWRKNIREHVSTHEARFRVYVQADGTTPADSPAPQSPSPAVSGGGTQFGEILPVIVNMSVAQNIVASPNGWIDDCPGGICTANETQTLGNNVLACVDRTAPNNTCDTDAGGVLDGNGRPTGNPDANTRNRDFLGTAPRDFQTNFLPPPQGGAGGSETGQTSTGAGASGTNALDQFRRGSVTNQFYASNWYHDKLFALGFDEASANFQQTNFSGMGLGGDRVLLDVHDVNGVDNANFATPPDGVSGRAQMFRFTGPIIDRDGGLDNEILLHELTHGTSNRLVGNAAGLIWDTARGMGEGWSDFYAMALLNNTNADDPDDVYASGAYATFKIAGLAFLDNYVYGIRRFPYSTDNAVNPMTWADVDDVTNNLAGGIPPTTITGFNNAGGHEVHNSGELWALSLWEVRSRIIADPAGANGSVPTGNQTTLQLVTDGLKLTPNDPRYTEARDAILDADCAANACANEESIWGGFADRGLGYGAAEPYNIMGRFVRSHVGIKESFSPPFLDVADVPTDVAVDDSASNNNGNIDPGEAVELTITLTNPWRAASKAVTGATATLSSSTTGVTIFDNTSTYGAIAPQGSAAGGDSFGITIDTTVVCGSALNFSLSVTSNLGTTVTTFQLRMGGPSGTDPAVTYTGDPNPDLTIIDNRGKGVFHQINITDDFVIADVNFRIDSITHTFPGDVTAMLRSPGGRGTDFIALIGGLLAGGGDGDNITNMLIDDDLVASPATDMVQAPNTAAPYTGSWLPVYNSPWIVAVGLTPDPVPNLSLFDGTSTLGTWSAHVADNFQLDAGLFNSWSMIVTPVHFACVPFAPVVVPAATKTVAGTFTVGGTVTYTVTLTNSGTDAQGDNPGDEFSDTLPASLTLVSADDGGNPGTIGTAGNTVTWNGTLAPLGGSVTITITATINAGTQGQTISNQGTMSYDSNNDNTNDATLLTDDPGVGGATDPTSFTVGASAVSATKTVSPAGPYEVGDVITYTIVISNTGSSASGDNPGNEFTDTIPAGLTVGTPTATSGTISGAGVNPVTWNGTIPASGSVTITIPATINAGTEGQTVSNQGTVSFDADLNGTNESTVQTDDPGAGGAADPTNFQVEGGGFDPAIPTVSEVGLVVLGLALLLAAWTVMRRRKTTA